MANASRSAARGADRLREVAEERFGWARLRPEQVRAMRLLLDGHDVLVVLPTGAGKSAVYQVPAVLLDGPTLVVSPLLALQRDQVTGLRDSDAPDAVAVNSEQSDSDTQRAWDRVRGEEAEYVFLAPEQLAREDVVSEVAESRPSLVVVDEAHCVSTWGHDFRPDYLRLGEVVQRLGHPRVLALTATAALPVREDILHHLGMRDPEVVLASFDRPNLHLEARRFASDEEKRAAVIERVLAGPSPGLLYVATRRDTERYASALTERGVRAAPYHAGMKKADRRQTQEAFMADEVAVVVATSAFGMGVDKPNIRVVLHASVPSSLDSYYQEIGRAGRDGEPANAVLFYRPEDLGLQRFLSTHGADADVVRQVAAAARDLDDLDRSDVDAAVDRPRRSVTRAVNLLQQAGVLTVPAPGRVHFRDRAVTPEGAVRQVDELVERHQRMARSRIEMMRGYAETTGCRREYLLGYFGETRREPCGACDICEAGMADSTDDGPFPPNGRVQHAEWGSGVVTHSGPEQVTVLFESVGYKVLSVQAVQERGLLTAAED